MSFNIPFKADAGFDVDGYTGTLSHSLSSATPLVIVPPAGGRVRLVTLYSQVNTPAPNVSISGSIKGAIITSLTLEDGSALGVGTFCIGLMAAVSATAASSASGLLAFIDFGKDEPITVSTSEVAANVVTYSIAEGS